MSISVNGTKAHAATGGMTPPAGAPTLIFIHGVGMDGTVWSMQSRYFARHGHRVLALDLPGHGQSEGLPLGAISEMAIWVASFMDAAEVKTAVVVGHSMGALVALHLASSQPDRVIGLGLLGIADTMPIHPDLQAAADANQALAAELIADWGFSPDMHRGGHQLPGFWAMGAGLALLKNAKDGVLSAGLSACAAFDTAVTAARQVTCPTALVLGEFDKMTPPNKTSGLVGALPTSNTTLIPRAGHMMMVEKPYETGRALKTIL